MHRWIKADDIEVGDIVLDGSDSHPNLVFAERVVSVSTETSEVWVFLTTHKEELDSSNVLRYRKGSTVTVMRGI